jgi:hypothetical protein
MAEYRGVGVKLGNGRILRSSWAHHQVMKLGRIRLVGGAIFSRLFFQESNIDAGALTIRVPLWPVGKCAYFLFIHFFPHHLLSLLGHTEVGMN